MTDITLLTVVEVSKDERVKCQAIGCNHSVYKRIHVIEENNTISVLGSECYKRLFGEVKRTPRYGVSKGKLLTTEERMLLIDNTARLIASMEAEHELQARQQSIKQKEANVHDTIPNLAGLSENQLEQIAKQQLSRTMKVNLDLPGYRGLVEAEVRKLQRLQQFQN